MKKILPTLLAIALIGIAEFANAQEFNFGLKAGANFANLSGDDADGDGITSYHAGALGRFTFTVIGVQAEALLSSQGVDLDGDKLNLTYLNVPVMARLNLVAGKLGILAGPQFGYLLSASVDGLPDGIDEKDIYKDLDVSWVIGAEVDIALGFLAGARYYQSFSSIGEDYTTTINGTDIDIDGGDVKNSVFQLYVGYKF